MAHETPEDGGRELTGRMVLVITVTFFAIVIGVNVFMAWSAIGTFPGLEVKNSYVASQEFDQRRAAQEALGWDVRAAFEGDMLRLDMIGPDGAPVIPAAIDATLGRATEVSDDRAAQFAQTDTGAWLADVEGLDWGYWVLRMMVTARDGTLFQQRIELLRARP